MYLSVLRIDIGTNPDRPRPGRQWLRNLYHVHQRLCMAFPSNPRRQEDPHFLSPYDPADFPEHRWQAGCRASELDPELLRQVHAPRDRQSGFLFRIDPLPGQHPVIVVQSSLEPDWDYAFHNAGFLLAQPPEVQPYDPTFSQGQRLRFRLLANTVYRARQASREVSGQLVDPRWVEKRLPVPATESALRNWLERRAGPAGFRVEQIEVCRLGYVYAGRRPDQTLCRFRSTLYEGTLQVLDPEVFLAQAVIGGIGPAKAFGFGLLSLARTD
ncbi:MAG: type I-E CRISPR-associated protein Cas6/Cse3/CasE [Thermoguttaceae bacterium]